MLTFNTFSSFQNRDKAFNFLKTENPLLEIGQKYWSSQELGKVVFFKLNSTPLSKIFVTVSLDKDMGRGGDRVVNLLVLYSGVPSSNLAEVYDFSVKIDVEKDEHNYSNPSLTIRFWFSIFCIWHCQTRCVTRLGDLLDFGQLFKACGNNKFAQISHILRQFL